MHARQAAILGQILDDRMIAGVLGDQFDQLGDHVAQLVNLALSRKMATSTVARPLSRPGISWRQARRNSLIFAVHIWNPMGSEVDQ